MVLGTAVGFLVLFGRADGGAAPKAEPPPDSTQADSLSAHIAELLQAAQQALDTKPAPPEAVLKIYAQAKTLLGKARSDLAKGESLRAEARLAPERLAALKAQLAEESAPLPSPSLSITSLAEVERAYMAAKDKLRALEQARELADARSKELERRIGEIPDEVSRAAESLTEARKQRDEPLPEDKPVGLAAATGLLRRAEECGAAATLGLLEIEREHAAIVGDVVRAELSVAERRIDHARRVEKHWSEALKTKRRELGLELARKAREMEKEFAGRDRALTDLCAENVVLAEDASGPEGVIALLRKALARRREVDTRLTEVQNDYKDIQARLRLMGVTKGVGGLLIEQQDRLPLKVAIEGELATSRRELNAAQLRSLQLREKSKEARRDGPTLQAALAALKVVPETPEWQAARHDAERILELRRELLTEVSESYTKYQSVLSETIAAEQELLKTVEEVSAFVEEKVLWVRNMPLLSLEDFRQARKAIRDWEWRSAGADLARDAWEDLQAHPIHAGGVLLAAAVLLVGRLGLRRRIRRFGRQVSDNPPGTFHGTLRTLLLTCASGFALPTMLWVVAWRLTATPPNATTTAHLSEALNALGYLLLPIWLIHDVCQRDGLAAAHLRMDRARLAAVRKTVRLFIILVVPLLCVHVVLRVRPTTDGREALDRLTCISGQLIMAALAAVLLRRGGPMLCGEGDKHKAGHLNRYWWLWYPAAITSMVLLAGASAAGYHYSAVEISTRIEGMVLMVLVLLVVHDVIVRGLWMLRRQTVRREIRKSREAEQDTNDASERELQSDLLREAVGQVTSVSARTARLVRYALWTFLAIGLYLMWEDALPAFRFLSRTNLYAIGDVQVTLAGLLLAVLTAVVAVAAVRTLPGILEVYVLSRVGMDVGERSAVATLARYLLVIAGVLAVSARLGVTWANVQWIVAALGVGLGFGLQDIVANLFSGLLLLLDGRIRLMDIVTVGDETGRVTAIRTLSTTITNWTNKEIVIPNKEFTTGRVTNWTLSERTVRLDVPVGIAYGSDTCKTEEILIRVGTDNEFTLDDPPVRARFLGFGASSLDFALQVWLPNMEHYWDVRHDLHRAIDDAFREAGITIAFPQLDVHVNSPGESLAPSVSPLTEIDGQAPGMER